MSIPSSNVKFESPNIAAEKRRGKPVAASYGNSQLLLTMWLPSGEEGSPLRLPRRREVVGEGVCMRCTHNTP